MPRTEALACGNCSLSEACIVRRKRVHNVGAAQHERGRVAEAEDARDLKSCGGKPPCGFESRLGQLGVARRGGQDASYPLFSQWQFLGPNVLGGVRLRGMFLLPNGLG